MMRLKKSSSGTVGALGGGGGMTGACRSRLASAADAPPADDGR
jgi:hypothetical protein